MGALAERTARARDRSGRLPGAAIGRPRTPARVEGATLWRASASRAREWWGAALPPRSSTRASTRPPRGLSSSLPAPLQRPRPLQERLASPVWAHCASEIHADFWSVGKLVDCGSTAWIRSTLCVPNSAGRALAIATGIAAASSGNVANHENDRTLRLASTNAYGSMAPLSRSQGDPALPPKMAEADRA
jgi:hypothetical protein